MLLFIIVSCNSFNKAEIICGYWEGYYNDIELLFFFENNNKCILEFKKNNSSQLESLNGIYELDFSKKPTLLTIQNIPQLNHSLYTIIEFISNDIIKIAEFSPKWKLRPISLLEGKILKLNRIK